MDIQQSIQDVEAVRPYVWEIASFFAILGVSRITQWLKQRKFFPAWGWLTKTKTSADGRHQFTKLKVVWLRTFNYLGSATIVTYCLFQRYPDLTQVLVVVAIIEMNMLLVIEGGLKWMEKHNPDMANIAREGLFTPDTDATVMTKFVQIAVLGGGEDTRTKDRTVNPPQPPTDDPTRTRVMTEEEHAEITAKKK